jgi:hypothetical protein
MKTRSILSIAMLFSIFVMSTAACTTERDADEEAVAATADGLVTGSGPNGNVTITPDELSDPATGCFVLKPICSLSSGGAATSTREIAILSSDACLRRASEWSLWCGNRQGAQTTAIFKVHNVVLRSTTFVAPNDTRCVVSLGVCQRYPNVRGTFGDAFEGSDTNPIRCAARAKDFHEWCANAPLAKVSARFDQGGVAGPTTFWPAL